MPCTGGTATSCGWRSRRGEGKDDPPYDPFALLLADEEGDVGEASGEYDGLIEGEDGGAAADGDAAATAADGPLSDDEDEDEDDFDLSPYNADGSVSRPRSELVALKSGLPAGGLFAVIRLGGSQEKVTVDDVVVVNKLKPVDRWAVGETITLTGPDVLLAGSTHLTLVGLPGVAAAEVECHGGGDPPRTPRSSYSRSARGRTRGG